MKKISFSFLFLFFVLLAFPRYIFAAVVINEVSPATSPEWVELYNESPDSVSLQGYVIDFGSDTQKKSFCDNDQIAGNSYRAIILTASWLNNEGDTVTLKSGSNVTDSISYGSGTSLQKPNNTQSITRSPDGSLSWILTDAPTQQGDTVTFECPTPTPTPTDFPTPTKVPTPTPTKTPTPTPTSKPVNTPAPTKTPTLIPITPTRIPAQTAVITALPTTYKSQISPTSHVVPSKRSSNNTTKKTSSEVLGLSTSRKDTSGSKTSSNSGGFFTPTFFILSGLGIITGACGILLFREWRKQKEEEI